MYVRIIRKLELLQEEQSNMQESAGRNMSRPAALPPGTTLGGQYIIDSLLNSGGFGAIYRGIDSGEGNRLCAIKETYDVTPASRRQALMEASVLFTVRSKHLPEVYDAFEANGRFYLVMQLIEGQNLLQLLKSRVAPGLVGVQQPYQLAQGPCTVQEALSWLLPIMEVLQELHSRRPAVMHRDIKPANIILTPNSMAVLVDFGLTKLYDPYSSTQTLTSAVSEGFSPVEQYGGKTSPQSDIYSMAATLYLLLTNRLPPPALKRRLQDELIAPRLLNPSLSSNSEQALLKALSVDADQRYQSMSEFAQALWEPAFSTYNDQTIATSPVAPIHGSQPVPPSYGNYAGAPNTNHPPRAQAIWPPTAVPPGHVMAPHPALASVQPLPSSFGQGCLWGIMQGILAALLVLFLKKEVYFYLAILMGFMFYVIAGFTTTRRGGSSLRGGWSGYWAGIISTITFWAILGAGLATLVSQRIEADTAVAHRKGVDLPPNEVGRVWRAVLPAIPNHSIAPSQTPFVNILISLLGGLLLAFALGWTGGLWGASRHRSSMFRKKRP